MKRERTDHIVVWTTESTSLEDLGPRDLDVQDRKNGFFQAIHHYLIRRCGTVVPGRDPEGPAMGLRGRSGVSVLVRIVGGVEDGVPFPNFTRAQRLSLRDLLDRLEKEYPTAVVECVEFNLTEAFKDLT
jgi:hypothetical protein